VSELQQPLQFLKQLPPQPFGRLADVQVVGQLGWHRHWPPWQVLPDEHTELSPQLPGQLAEIPLHT
jgi:hypothetical protein